MERRRASGAATDGAKKIKCAVHDTWLSTLDYSCVLCEQEETAAARLASRLASRPAWAQDQVIEDKALLDDKILLEGEKHVESNINKVGRRKKCTIHNAWLAMAYSCVRW